MLTVSEETKEAFRSDSIRKNLRIVIDGVTTLTNEDIVYESFEVSQSIEENSSLRFVGCNASKLQFQSVDLSDDVRGKKITVFVTAGDTEEIQLFTGYIDEQTNQTHDAILCEITAYDILYKINNSEVTSWYNGLSFPMTLLNFRNSFFDHFGVAQESADLAFDSLTLTKTIEPEQISGYEILSKICEINAAYGMISRTGTFRYISLGEIKEGLYPFETLYPEDDLYPVDDSPLNNINRTYCKSIEYEAYNVDCIDKIQIREEEDDIGAIYGDGTNAWIIEGNFLTYGFDDDTLASIAQTLYSKVHNIDYMPFDVECVAVPWLDCGDIVQMSTRKKHVYSYILQRKLSGIQIMDDELSADGSKSRGSNLNSVNTQITQLEGKTNKLTRTASETKSELTSFEKDTEGNFKTVNSTITQTASEIRAEVSETYETKTDASTNYSSLSSSISQTATQIKTEVSQTYETKTDASSSYSDLSSSITQTASAIKTEVSETYETKTDASSSYSSLSSSITQTASAIKLEVSQNYETLSDAKEISGKVELKLNTSDLTSEFNAKANVITLTSDNFKLEANGKITATSGSIGGWEITSDYLSCANGSDGAGFISKPSSYSNIAIWAGSAAGSGWKGTDNPFYVTSDGHLYATNATISGYSTSSELEAATGRIGTLESDHVSTDDLKASNARITTLEADSLTASNINAASFTLSSGHIGNLSAGKITSGTLDLSKVGISSTYGTVGWVTVRGTASSTDAYIVLGIPH